MKDVLKAYLDYPWLSALLFVACIITAFVVYKANKASKKTRLEREAVIEILKSENKNRHFFKDLTLEKINSANPKDLLEGVALNLQASIEAQGNINAAYEGLKPQQKYIYALYYLLNDSKQGLSSFFAISGPPLTNDAGEAVDLILGRKAKELYTLECAAYDDENEEVSIIKEDIDKWDAEFAEILEKLDAYEAATGYIRENAEVFLNA